MAATAPATAATTAPEAAEPPAKGSKRRLILLAVPVGLAGIGAGLWFSGLLPRMLGREKKAEASAETGTEDGKGTDGKAAGGKGADAKGAVPKALPSLDMPDLIANLNVAPGRRASFIKLHVRIELARAEDMPQAQAALPRLQDLFQTYLREMRPEELRGSEGTWRLREELLARTNIAIAPARATDVLFTEMLVQ